MADQGEILAGLGEIFAEVFGREVALSPALTAKDVAGWDSFKQIEIVMAVEERWGMRFSTRELDGLRCVGDLVAVLAGKVG